MSEIRHVTVQDMLQARDERAARQQALLSAHALPLISFTMNIAGSVKYNAAIQRAYEQGVSRIARQLERMHVSVRACIQTARFTGCEALWAVQAEASALKKAMCLIEEADALGRLFDIDVIDADGTHLSRNSERPCLICGNPVRACARSRKHSAEELFEKALSVIQSHFENQLAHQIGELAQKALLYEALTTPKPGLVDAENSGSHSDMTLFSFADSVCTLRPYLEECVHLGIQQANPAQLQYAGMCAEDSMFSAAHVNTHKGAIFALGILCCAIGSLGEFAPLEGILAKVAEIGTGFLNQMKTAGQTQTGGERQYQQYGLTGARGEAASGYQSVYAIALPALKKAIAQGKSLPMAGLEALLQLMAHVQDSNIIRRAGMDGQHWVMEQTQRLLENGFSSDDLRLMNEQFVERSISPGGSADLLAVTYFLYFYQQRQPACAAQPQGVSMTRILFICLGNICRSPMAEFVMKDLIQKQGLSSCVQVDSAATSTWEIGNPVYHGTKNKLAEHGISCKGKTARLLIRDDYAAYDYLIGMDRSNMADMLEILGGDPCGKLSLMLDWTGEKRDVADPWYTHNFEATWQDVQRGCQALLEHLAKRNGWALK